MPYAALNGKRTELSRTLASLRKKARLTQMELAKLLKIPLSSVENYELGNKVPPPMMLERLAKALKCEDLVARFPPQPNILPAQLAQPTNVPLRLQHLIDVMAEGNQRRFAHGIGISLSTLNPLVNNKKQLSDEWAGRVLAGIPTLRREWLLKGVGEPFTAPAAPVFPPLPPAQKREAKRQSFPVRWSDMKVMRALPIWDPALNSPSKVPTSQEVISSLVERLEMLSENECGMSAAQVDEALVALRFAL